VQKLPAWGKKACYILSNVLMLYCVVLFFQGTWEQTKINIDNMAPATGLSTGWFYYSVGLFFCVSAAALLLRNLYQAVTGRLREDELIQVRESEEVVEVPRSGADGADTLPDESADTKR
jgi:TRAP-type C4-dicarboxylate transport system permease small subunit